MTKGIKVISYRRNFFGIILSIIVVAGLYSCNHEEHMRINATRYRVKYLYADSIQLIQEEVHVIKEISVSNNCDSTSFLENVYKIDSIDTQERNPVKRFKVSSSDTNILAVEEILNGNQNLGMRYFVIDTLDLSINEKIESVFILITLNPPIDASGLLFISYKYGVLLQYSLDWNIYIYYYDSMGLNFSIAEVVEAARQIHLNYSIRKELPKSEGFPRN